MDLPILTTVLNNTDFFSSTDICTDFLDKLILLINVFETLLSANEFNMSYKSKKCAKNQHFS